MSSISSPSYGKQAVKAEVLNCVRSDCYMLATSRQGKSESTNNMGQGGGDTFQLSLIWLKDGEGSRSLSLSSFLPIALPYGAIGRPVKGAAFPAKAASPGSRRAAKCLYMSGFCPATQRPASPISDPKRLPDPLNPLPD